MKVDGRAIASLIYKDLTNRADALKKNGVTPYLAVVLIGDDPGSVNYVAQKEKHAKAVGVELKVMKLPTTVSPEQLAELITLYNADPLIHGVIIQRPVPEQITKEALDLMVIPEKDVDGFHPNSDFAAPVALAVERILYDIFKTTPFGKGATFSSFTDWLLGQDIVVMGKGETAGTPIINHFHGRNAQVTVIDSQTEGPEDILSEADIIITAVGKKEVIPQSTVLRDKILIGVGLHMEEGKLAGDFENSNVETLTSYYTPTPGGVGPVNVAMLLSNVVRAAEEQSGSL